MVRQFVPAFGGKRTDAVPPFRGSDDTAQDGAARDRQLDDRQLDEGSVRDEEARR